MLSNQNRTGQPSANVSADQADVTAAGMSGRDTAACSAVPSFVPLRRKLLAPVVFGVVLLLATGILGMYWLISHEVENRLREQAQSIAAAVITAAENTEKTQSFQRFINAVAAEPGVELVMMAAGPQARVIASSRRRWIGKRLNDLPESPEKRELQSALEARHDGLGHQEPKTGIYRWTVYCEPILSEVAAIRPVEAAVTVHLATAAISARTQRSLVLLGGVVLAGVAGLLLLAWLQLHRHVLSPLAGIGLQLDLLSGDSGEVDPGDSRNDEVGKLALALNQTAQQRRTREAALREASRIIQAVTQAQIVRDIKERLVAEAPAGLAMFDTQMRYLACSTAWMDQYKLPRTENIIGRSHYELFPDLPERWKQVHQQTLAGVMHSAREDHFVRGDGSVLWNTWACRPWRLPSEEIGGIIIWAEDVTEFVEDRLRAQSVLQQFKSTLDVTHDSVFMFLPETLQFFYVNQRASEDLGYSEAELLQMHPYDIKPLFPEPKFREFIAPLLSGSETSRRFETHHRHRDGHDIPVEVFLQMIAPEGEPARFVAIASDITERRRLQQALVEERDRLDVMVQQRTLELQLARDAAEAATRAKSEFLANMSHEVRSPMSVIMGCTNVLLAQNAAAAERDAAAAAIRRNGKHLLRLINDVLDLSRIEAGKLPVEIEECDPSELLQMVVDNFRVQAEEKRIQLTLVADGPVPRSIHTDPTRLRQILINFLANALKFTESGKTVTVGLAIHPHSQSVCFSVLDQGIGITPEQLPRLFRPFEQADNSATRHFGGSGLGLSICRLLADAMEATIEVSSEPGIGSSFRLLLPLAENTPLHELPADWAERHATAEFTAQPETIPNTLPTVGGRVLLVEDSPDVQQWMVFFLQMVGCDVTTAAHGRLGLEMALQQAFDLILMDLQMPEMDGLTATRELRTAGYSGPMIGLSANAMKGDRERALAAGLDEYLTKPVDTELLLATLQRFVPAPPDPLQK